MSALSQNNIPDLECHYFVVLLIYLMYFISFFEVDQTSALPAAMPPVCSDFVCFILFLPVSICNNKP